jgi:hypothetical protein
LKGVGMNILTSETLSIILFIANAVIVLNSYILKSLHGQQKNTREDFLNYKLHVAEKYATHDSINDNFERLNKRLDKLFEEVHRH